MLRGSLLALVPIVFQNLVLARTAVGLDYRGSSDARRVNTAKSSSSSSSMIRREASTGKIKSARRSKMRHGRGQVLQENEKPKHSTFPLYTRAATYVHPLDDNGQAVEKKAVDQIESASVMGHLRELVEFPTRSFSNFEQSTKVEHHLKQKFEDMGYTVCFQNFNDESGGDATNFTNVIAYVPGSKPETITVGAHYDSRPFAGKAPGAEDNGSGVASVLAMAKAFADAKISPSSSVYFVAFAGEEPGLVGSKHFAEALNSGGDSIPGECKSTSSFLQMSSRKSQRTTHRAIIMDEIGWASPALKTPTVNLESFDWTRPVMDHLCESSKMHNGDSISVTHSSNPFGSDHMSFLDNNMMAVLTINGDDEAYPNYHQSSDTIDNVSPDLLTMITKMNLGALIRMAGVKA